MASGEVKVKVELKEEDRALLYSLDDGVCRNCGAQVIKGAKQQLREDLDLVMRVLAHQQLYFKPTLEVARETLQEFLGDARLDDS